MCVQLLSPNPWTVARQPPLSMGFPRQEEYWSGLPHLLCLLHGQADSLLLCRLGNKEGRRRKEKTKRKEEREVKGKPEMKPRETRRETSSIHLQTLGSFATLPWLFFSSLEP